MRADKDFKTYEQALTAVQRFGELAEADHQNGRHKEALYNLSHATFVGVKHLLFMAADAAIDRAEARDLAAKNHLATIELLSLTLAASGAGWSDGEVGGTSPDAKAPARTVRPKASVAAPTRTRSKSAPRKGQSASHRK